MTMPTRESIASGPCAVGVGLAIFLALGVAAAPLAAQVRDQGHSDGSAGEAPHARSEPGGDRGSWNHGGGSGSSGGGSTASPGSGSSGDDGTVAQPRSSSPGSPPGGGRGDWRGRSGRRDDGHHSGSGRGHYGYGHRPYYGNPWWGWWGWGWGWGEPYGGVYGGGYGGYGRRDGDYDEQGALDLDIWPGDTQVYLDGQNIGTVDDFDGFPSYLWLEKGTYDIVFYREGFQTLARQYSIYSGLTIDVGDRLVPGDSVRPEDLATKTHVRRDTRVDDERERSERIDGDDGGYRDRRGRDERPSARRDNDQQGRVILSIEPDDASVYLDGQFVGTAEEISRLHRGLVVDAGQHRISVVRPGRRGSEQTFTVRPGSEQEIEIELETSDE